MKREVRRGQPLVGLGLLLVSWVGVRAALLETEGAEQRGATTAMAHQRMSARPPITPQPVQMLFQAVSSDQPANARRSVEQHLHLPPVAPIAPPNPMVELIPAPTSAPVEPIAAPTPVAPRRWGDVRIAGGHQLLLIAALAQLPLPPEAAGATSPARVPQRPEARFSGDAWLLLRRGGGGPGLGGAFPPTYGASQVGAVIRYRLAPASPRRPALYLRATGAVRWPHDEEAAFGLSLRPVRGVPVAAMAEARVAHLASGTIVRPAAMLVSELPPLRLPGAFTAETYGAAGYVGGAFASAFAEGQVRVERPIARLGTTELRAGGGAWGGVQQGASRVDLGPSASLGFPLGSGGGRLSVDWRFRLVGKAVPASGPALTISAGF